MDLDIDCSEDGPVNVIAKIMVVVTEESLVAVKKWKKTAEKLHELAFTTELLKSNTVKDTLCDLVCRRLMKKQDRLQDNRFCDGTSSGDECQCSGNDIPGECAPRSTSNCTAKHSEVLGDTS